MTAGQVSGSLPTAGRLSRQAPRIGCGERAVDRFQVLENDIEEVSHRRFGVLVTVLALLIDQIREQRRQPPDPAFRRVDFVTLVKGEGDMDRTVTGHRALLAAACPVSSKGCASAALEWVFPGPPECSLNLILVLVSVALGAAPPGSVRLLLSLLAHGHPGGVQYSTLGRPAREYRADMCSSDVQPAPVVREVANGRYNAELVGWRNQKRRSR